MSFPKIPFRQIAAIGALTLLAACAQPYGTRTTESMPISNPPPVPPGPGAIWHHVNFATASFAIDADGQKTIADIVAYMQQNPQSEATIIGKTDTVGSPSYNMHLSHQRADAVRNALVYDGKVAAERVETRWTGESRQRVATTDETAEAGNRVVNIALH